MAYQNKITTQETAVVAKDAAISGAIDYRNAEKGSFILPAAMEATTKIAFKVSESLDGTYVPLFSSSNALVEVTITVNASKCYALPSDLAGCSFFKFWTEASGSDVAQATAARNIIVMTKS